MASEEEFQPTFEEFEAAIKKRYSYGGVLDWLYDYLRANHGEAKKLYDWLREGERLGMFHEIEKKKGGRGNDDRR